MQATNRISKFWRDDHRDYPLLDDMPARSPIVPLHELEQQLDAQDQQPGRFGMYWCGVLNGAIW